MDYYNDFVIQPMTVDMIKVMVEKKLAPEKEHEMALERIVRHSTFIEQLISPEGTFPAFGRSITYRLAVFQSLGQVALLGRLSPELIPAEVRSALIKVMLICSIKSRVISTEMVSCSLGLLVISQMFLIIILSLGACACVH